MFFFIALFQKIFGQLDNFCSWDLFMKLQARLSSIFTLQAELDILDILPFLVILSNIWKIRSSAGISRNYIGLSCISSFLFLFTSKYFVPGVLSFFKFLGILCIFILVAFKFPLKSERFKDPKWTFFIIPASVIFSLFTFIDDNFLCFIKNIGLWLKTLSLLCQVTLTKQSKRVNLLHQYLPVFCICQFCEVYLILNQAFRTTGTEMWFYWFNGVGILLLSIDLFFFVNHSKKKDDDFELPIGQFGNFD